MKFQPKKLVAASAIIQFLFFAFVGVLLFVFAGLTLAGQSGDYEKTSAVIEEINPIGDGEYQVIVSYTVEGKSYLGELGYYSSDMMKGNEITIKYKPDDPEIIRASSVDIIGYILLAGGALVIFLGARTLSTRLKRVKQNQVPEVNLFGSKGNGMMGNTMMGNCTMENDWVENGSANADDFPGDAEGTLYYFHYDKKFSAQGHVMEDQNRQLVYEGSIRNFKLVGDFEMDFINHVSGRTEMHHVGHTITTRSGRFTTSSGFDFDGENIWDYLYKQGVQSNIAVENIMTSMSINVTVCGRPFARYIASGTNLYGDETNGFKKAAGSLIAPGFYRIVSFTDDLDLLFLIAVAFTRSRAN